MKKISLWKIILVLAIFSPLAFLPAASRAALLTSRTYSVSQDTEIIRDRVIDILTEKGITRDHAEEIMDRLSPREIEVLALSRSGYLGVAGKDGVTESLETNEIVAIVLTVIMLAVVVGFVEISRH
ncbi:MAG TPA: hypothetical protein ENH12_03275 [Proteobacteria bacterium]|nr:hypothetical protein [Pseudomonadota bacterium]